MALRIFNTPFDLTAADKRSMEANRIRGRKNQRAEDQPPKGAGPRFKQRRDHVRGDRRRNDLGCVCARGTMKIKADCDKHTNGNQRLMADRRKHR